MIQPKTRLRILVAGTAVVVLWFVVAIVFTIPWLARLAPVLLAVWLLLTVQHGYLLLRANRWARRQREEKKALESLAIPRDVRKSEEFEGVKAIDDLQKRVLAKPPDYQGQYRLAGVTVALLPPLALSFLTFQSLVVGHDGPWAAGFVIAEAMFLAILVYLVGNSLHPSLQWVQSRLRAELLRREQYLRLACVGPYLGLTPVEAEKTAANRLDLLEKGDLPGLWRLIPLATPIPEDGHHADRRWMDDLWTQTVTATQLPDPIDRMRCYLHYRIDKQLMWFSLGVQLNLRFEKWIRRTLWTAVLCALVAALVHGGLLLGHVDHKSTVAIWIILLAFVLPPLCAAL